MERGSVSYGRATSLLPVVELVRGYFHIEARDDARKIREKVTGKLLSLDRQLEPCLTALLWLLDVPGDDVQCERLDPPHRRQRARRRSKFITAPFPAERIPEATPFVGYRGSTRRTHA